MAMSGRAPGITHPAAATDQPANPAADANMHWQPQASGQSTLAGAACRAGGSDLQNSMPVACSLGGADVGSSMLTGTTGSPAGVGICSAGLNCTAGIASTAGKAGAPCPNHGSHEQQSRGKGSMSRACSPDSCVKDGLAYVALLVPCRKAMRNQFPLNGTFFQVNEVFLDQATITQPLQVQFHLDTVTAHGGRETSIWPQWPASVLLTVPRSRLYKVITTMPASPATSLSLSASASV